MGSRAAGAILIAAVAVALAACDRPAQPGPPQEEGTASDDLASGAIVEEVPLYDPVCQVELAGPTALSVEHGGHTYYFDREECRQRFAADPGRPEWMTGAVGQGCVCTAGIMQNCKCAHCSGRQERCDCMR